jgi:hypothetical protein
MQFGTVLEVSRFDGRAVLRVLTDAGPHTIYCREYAPGDDGPPRVHPTDRVQWDAGFAYISPKFNREPTILRRLGGD